VPGPQADEPREQDDLLPGLVRARVRPTRKAAAAAEPLADVDPVAQVLVDVPLAHLDRAFDYAVPASMADDAQPGVRVKPGTEVH
jgi:primosomal protein N' (replication factor Y)